jgi:RHS repeat-associated protein
MEIEIPPGSGAASSKQYILSSITLPNNLSYSFTYNNYGEVTKVTYPTGGYTQYNFTAFTYYWMDAVVPAAADFRELTSKLVCRQASGSCTSEDTTTYTPTISGTLSNNQYTDVVYPPGSGETAGDRTHFQFGVRTSSQGVGGYWNFAPRELYRYIYQGQSTLLRTVETDYNGLDPTYNLPTNSSLPIRTTTTLNDTSQVTKTEWDYDTTTNIDNVQEKREYDYGAGTFGALLRRTDYTWLETNPINSQNYTATSLYIMDRKASEIVYNGSGITVAQTTYEYDNFTGGISSSGAVQHGSTFGTTYTTRGNLTAKEHWRNTDGAWLTTRNQYDDAGNISSTTDPKNNTTTFSHVDSWGNSTCAPSGGNAAAYLTKVTDALTHISSKKHNSCAGNAASVTDENGQTTTMTYDLMDRMIQTTFPLNPAGQQGQINVAYNEAAKPLNVVTTGTITSAMNLVTTKYVDGLGRVYQSQLNSDLQGITYTDTTYDALGRKATVSNPYRSTSDPTYGVTTTEYDALGRVTIVIPPDGTASSNNVSTSYSGNCTTVTDQAGKVRKSCVDGMSRLVQVFEPNSSNAFVNETDYTLDALNNLTLVNQKGNTTNSAQWRTRTFVYDSLSELTSSSNPEAGSVTYTYDNDGNVSTKTDARSITTTQTYDSLNRPTGVTFSNGDPSIAYFYDQTSYNGLTIVDGIGRRTGMSDAAGAEAWTYESMGRVTTARRTTSGITQNTSCTYNLDGSVATLTYPSGRVVTYTPSAAARPVSAVDTPDATNYATSASYAPTGALASLQNATGIVTTNYYNSRLQPCRVSIMSSGTAPTSCADLSHVGNILDYSYSFNSGTQSNPINNGTVQQIADNVNTARTQNFTYDELNRVKTAASQATTGTYAWGLQFSYDIWANLLSATVTQGSAPMLSATVGTNNQITNTGFSYDAAGNVLADGSNSYSWDGASQLKTAAGVTYTYDGDGRRAEKSNGKLYWYGTGSEPLAESDSSGNFTDEYVFLGGKRIARRDSSGNVDYYFADQVESTRVVTNTSGTLLDDSDFYPFGGERPAMTNTSGNNYKFQSKERDTETGNDEFGARSYSSSFGRFLSPDWSAVPAAVPYADLANPQTLNLYQIVKNDPVLFIDADGHSISTGGTGSNVDPGTETAVVRGGIEGCLLDSSCDGDTIVPPSTFTITYTIGETDNEQQGATAQSQTAQNQSNQQTQQSQQQSPTQTVLTQVKKEFPDLDVQAVTDLHAHNGHENIQVSGTATPKQLEDMRKTLNDNKGLFGPGSRIDIKIGDGTFSLHMEKVTFATSGDSVTFQSHIDRGNPNRDLVGMGTHAIVDGFVGSVFHHNDQGLDPR